MRTVATACLGLGIAATIAAGCSSLGADGGGTGAGAPGPGSRSGGSQGSGGAPPLGTAEEADLGADNGALLIPTSSSAGLGMVCLDVTSPELIARAPDTTRPVDSAVYARAALRMHLAPDQNLLRLNDFLNFYGSSASYADAPSEGEVEYVHDLGVIEARFRIPAEPSHKPRGFVVLVDTSMSMQPRFALEQSVVKAMAAHVDSSKGDVLRVYGWSTELQPIFDEQTSTTLDVALETAFKTPGGSSDLSLALPKALGIAESLGVAEPHVLLLTDGAAGANNLEPITRSFAERGVDLDVALLALSKELADAKTPDRALPYNQSLLTKLTPTDGARLFVTDSTDALGATDVGSLFKSRFDEFFGSAIEAPRATFSVPAVLKIVSVNATVQGADASSLVARGVGYDRMLTVRAHVEELPSFVTVTTVCPAGGALSAELDRIPGTSGPTKIFGNTLTPPSPLGLTRVAIVAYVEALRTSQFVAAKNALDVASVATCGAATDPLCAANTETSA